MLVALGTLPFLATLWLLAVLGLKVLEESGEKIVAALKGKSEHRFTSCHPRTRARPRVERARHFGTRWRAAA